MAPRFDPQGAANFSFPATGSKVRGGGRAVCAMHIPHVLPRGPWAGPGAESCSPCEAAAVGRQARRMERGGVRGSACGAGGRLAHGPDYFPRARGRAEPGAAVCARSGDLRGGVAARVCQAVRSKFTYAVGRCGPARPVGARQSRRAGQLTFLGPVACASALCASGLTAGWQSDASRSS